MERVDVDDGFASDRVRGVRAREILRTRTRDGVLLAVTRLVPGPGNGTAALLLHGFGQNRHFFDQPGRSFAEYLAAAGLDVFLLELRGHGLSRGRRGPYARALSDYADLDLPAALTVVRGCGAREVFLIGHSLGGLTCLAASTALLSTVRGVVVLGSPTHLGCGAPFVRLLAVSAEHLLRSTGLDRPPPKALPTEVLGDFLSRFHRLFEWPLPLPIRLWVPGQIEQQLLRRYLRSAFDRESVGIVLDLAGWAHTQCFDRSPGRESIHDRLRAFPVPIQFVVGRQDRLVPPSSVRPGFELTRAPSKAWRVFGERDHRGRYGHVDLVLGRHAPTEVWPEILSWLRSL